MKSSTIYVLRYEVAPKIISRCMDGLADFNEELKRISGFDDFDLSVGAAPEWIQDEIDDALDEPTSDIDSISEQLANRMEKSGEGRNKVLVLCRRTHRLALRAKEQLPHAEWGVAIQGGTLAVVYGNFQNYPVWHEVLHLYGADDCYDPEYCRDDPGGLKTTCGTKGCIMGFGVRLLTGEKKLTLCKANAKLVRAHVKGLSNG